MTTHSTRIAAVASVGALMLGITPVVAAPAGAVGVPGLLNVTRTGDGTDLAITWKAAAGIDHYTVNVFDGTTDRATVVPAGTTSFRYDGSGVCTRYQVRVTAAGSDGTLAVTNPYLVGSLAPSGVATLTARRTESGASGAIAWTAPRTVGATPLTAYSVVVRNMATGKAVLDTKVGAGTTSVSLSSLDPARRYSAKVTPSNSFGSCATSTTQLFGAAPSNPLSFQVDRDPATPSRLALSWAAPSWAGYGPVTEYEVGYGDLKITRWVRTTGRTLGLTLPANVNHVFAVRAISSNDVGTLTPTLTLAKVGAPGTPAVDPKVTVDELDGTVTVTATGPVGTSAAYPKMRISIDPTIKGSWRDEHVVSNGASLVSFTQVPCGVYTVLVTGYGNGSEREFGRKVLNRCDVGAVPSERWKVVYGAAKIAGDLVDVTTAGERRIMSTLKRTSGDMVLTTTAHLRTGWGYGIWARADVSAGGAAVSGYSMQYDPGYAKVSSFGPALLLRLWSNGKECGTPLAKVPFPAGVDTYAPHQFTVVLKGDTLYATIDGKSVFNVSSLAGAVKANGCGMPAPTGTEIGFRTWNDTTATFSGTTLN